MHHWLQGQCFCTKLNDGEMLEIPRSDYEVNQSAIEILLYVNLQIAEMIIGILGYKILSNMQKSVNFMNLLQLTGQGRYVKVGRTASLST